MSTWILLRGLARGSAHWGDFPAALRSEIADAEIVTLDLPGNGLLNRVRSPRSVAEMARFCRAEIDARGIRPPYYLLALSLGAMVAIEWAESHPEDLLGCVLINTSLRRLSPFYRRLRPGSYAPFVGLVLPGVSVEAREAIILRITSKLAANPRQVVKDWSIERRRHPVSRANALRQLWAASHYRAPARKPPVPTLVLASAGDTLVDPSCSRRLAQAWQTDFAEHPSAGHDIPLDDGAWVARQVRGWTQRIAASR
jgi:pimeloyl-ACP methyl ester carboxylesterase